MAAVTPPDISHLTPEFQKAFQNVVKAERKPIDTLTERKGQVEKRVELLKDVLGKVDGVKKLIPELNSPTAIRELAVASTDDKTLTAAADKNLAVPGKYNLEVLRLATPGSALSNGFSDRNETKIGTGYFHVTDANGESREIYIDDQNATLDGLAKVINSARIGMKATVVNDPSLDPEAPFRLALTSEKVGTPGDLQYPEFYFVDGDQDFYLDSERPATNALVRYEGIEHEADTNEIKDLIPGVTLNLRGISEGRPTTLSIEQDIPKTKLKVKELVDQLNKVFTFIQEQNTMDEKNPEKVTLGGDYGVRTAESRLRTALQTRLPAEAAPLIRGLLDIGVEFQRTGTLKLDEKKLEAKLAADYDGVVNVLAGDGVNTGIITGLSKALTSISGAGTGVLSLQKQNYSDRVSQMQKQVENKEKALNTKTTALRDRLARAQTAISNLQSQSNNLTASLAGAGNK